MNLEVKRVPKRISSREGCREVLTCVGVDSQPTWRKEPGQVGGQIVSWNSISTLKYKGQPFGTSDKGPSEERT